MSVSPVCNHNREKSIAAVPLLSLSLWWALSSTPVLLDTGIPPHAAGLTGDDVSVVSSEAFLTAYPDQLYRLRAQGALHEGRPEQARHHFRRAAHYADKLSQAMLAQMLWDGLGGDVDRALGYAWMDLAAERGTPLLLAERERFWRALDQSEQERAVAEGQAIHATYADEVAKPRLEREMRKANQATIGSRIAARSAKAETCIGTARVARNQLFLCFNQVSTDRFYQDQFWEPEKYWAWQDQVLLINSGSSGVTVGDPATIQP